MPIEYVELHGHSYYTHFERGAFSRSAVTVQATCASYSHFAVQK